MKIIYPITLLLFLLTSAFCPGTSNCPALQTDGIYVYKLDAEHSAVIRFYDDKTVLVSTSLNDYKEVMTWFNREPENFSRVLTGKYKISKGNCLVSFKVKGESGEQKFFGTLTSDKTIDFNITNPAQKNEKNKSKTRTMTQRTYTFVKP